MQRPLPELASGPRLSLAIQKSMAAPLADAAHNEIVA
jgi:hypothetical protein